MMLGVVAFSSLLTWMVTTWTLRQHFDEIGRAIIADDLAEYAEIYERRASPRSSASSSPRDTGNMIRVSAYSIPRANRSSTGPSRIRRAGSGPNSHPTSWTVQTKSAGIASPWAMAPS